MRRRTHYWSRISTPQKHGFNPNLHQLEKALYQDRNESFIVMAVKDAKQVKAMLEVGFDYVCQKDDLVFLRKRQ
jgi:hypothetical protein